MITLGKRVFGGLAGFGVTIALATPSNAALLELGASNQAWYRQDGANIFELSPELGAISNTFTGFRQFVGNGPYFEYRSYFVFDVSSLQAPITRGSLLLSQREYYSTASAEEITLYDVKTPAADLLKAPPGKGVQIFQDLGTGQVYGKSTVTATPTQDNAGTFVGSLLEVRLSKAAIAAIKKAARQSTPFSLGIALTSFDHTDYKVSFPGYAINGAGFESISFSSPNIPRVDPETGQPIPEFPARLVLETQETDPPDSIPEPSLSLGMLLLASGWLAQQWQKRDRVP